MQSKKILLAAAIAPMSLGFSTSLIAEEATSLEVVTVTANRMEKSTSTVPNSVTIITDEEIGQQLMIDDSLAGVLERTVPGFAPSTQKMTGGTETLRGKNPLYTIDGISQHNSLRDGARDGFTIDMDFLERIEVVQGANAAQGIGATGGVINMMTLNADGPEGEWQNEVKVRLTSNDDLDSDSLGQKLTYIGSISQGNYDFVGGISAHSRGVFYDANGDRIGVRSAQGELQDSESTDIFLKLGYDIDQNQRVDVMFNDYTLENNGDLIPVSGDRTTDTYSTTVEGDYSDIIGDPAKNESTILTVNYSHKDIAGGKLTAKAYAQDYSALFEGSVLARWALTTGGDAFLDQSKVLSTKKGINLAYEKSELANVKNLRALFGLDYGTDTSSQKLEQTGRYWVPEMTLETISPFAQAEYAITDNILVSAGLRYEMATLNVDDFTTLASENSTFVEGGSPNYNELLKNIGVVYDLNDNVTFYASWSEGFDMPDAGRILRAIDTSGLDVDNIIDLDPVITDNVELGMNVNKGNWTGGVSVYQSKTDLGSRLEDDNSDGLYSVSREKQEIQGYTLNLDYYINENWEVGANYANQSGEYDSDDSGSVDTDLNNKNIAPNRLNTYVTLNKGNISGIFSISKLYDRTQKGDAALTDNRASFDGYTTANISLSYATLYGTYGLGIENLFNEEYETLYSQNENSDDRYFSGRGRTISASYQVKF